MYNVYELWTSIRARNNGYSHEFKSVTTTTLAVC